MAGAQFASNALARARRAAEALGIASDITLSAASRGNLLALQSTTSLLDRTSNRLASGLKVVTPVDGVTAFNASRVLTDRANAFGDLGSNISVAADALTTTIQSLGSIIKLVDNLSGILTSIASVSDSSAADALADQYNALLTQIDGIAQDSVFQGANLLSSGNQFMQVDFNDGIGVDKASLIINARRSDSVGLGGATLAHNIFFASTRQIASQPSAASVASVASHASVPSFASRPALVQVGAQSSIASLASVASQSSIPSTASNPSRASVASTASVPSAQSVPSQASAGSYPSVASLASSASSATIASSHSLAPITVAATAFNQTVLDVTNRQVTAALGALRTTQQMLGTNATVLQIRLEFTKNYVTKLQEGSDKLTLADLNQEGAFLATLQTRLQFEEVSLSITTKGEERLLRLF
jgi:flagellin